MQVVDESKVRGWDQGAAGIYKDGKAYRSAHHLYLVHPRIRTFLSFSSSKRTAVAHVPGMLDRSTYDSLVGLLVLLLV